MEFKIGDKIEWLGAAGEVVNVRINPPYFVGVDFLAEPGVIYYFCSDGRYLAEQEPSLELVERRMPKKKVKKTIERWVTVYTSGNITTHQTFDTEKEAVRARELLHPYQDLITIAKLTGEYEVEE